LQRIRFKGSFQDASRIAGSFFIFPITVVCSVGCYLSSLSPQSACVSVISSLVNEHQTPLCWYCNRSKHHLLYRFRIAFFLRCSDSDRHDKTAKTRGPFTPPNVYDIIKLTYLQRPFSSFQLSRVGVMWTGFYGKQLWHSVVVQNTRRLISTWLVFARNQVKIKSLRVNYKRFTALSAGLPGWAGTRRNIQPLTCPDHHPTFISFLHLIWSIASSLFNLRAWQSFCTTSVQVLFGLSLGLEPSAPYSIHFFTESVSSFRNTCPYHRSLFCCSTKIISSIHRIIVSLNYTWDFIFYPNVTQLSDHSIFARIVKFKKNYNGGYTDSCPNHLAASSGSD